LQQRLAEIDNRKPLRRIYVMGCGLPVGGCQVMTTFFDVDVVPRKLPVEYFGLLMTGYSVLVIKRDSDAYQWVQQMPANIEIVYIVRHPYDVLTSHLPRSGRTYHILPERGIAKF
jgi:hypothetical protein